MSLFLSLLIGKKIFPFPYDMTKAVSNRNIGLIKAVLLYCEYGPIMPAPSPPILLGLNDLYQKHCCNAIIKEIRIRGASKFLCQRKSDPSEKITTVCPRSVDPFYLVTYFIK